LIMDDLKFHKCIIGLSDALVGLLAGSLFSHCI